MHLKLNKAITTTLLNQSSDSQYKKRWMEMKLEKAVQNINEYLPDGENVGMKLVGKAVAVIDVGEDVGEPVITSSNINAAICDPR